MWGGIYSTLARSVVCVHLEPFIASVIDSIAMRRRVFLAGLAGLSAVGTVAILGKDRRLASSPVSVSTRRSFAIANQTSLRLRAATKGILYGAAIQSQTLSSDPKFARRVVEECSILVPEWELKWKALRPSPNRFNFSPGDKLAAFAKTHKLLMRGHTLVWHHAMPAWLPIVLNRQNAEQLLVDHVQTVVKHYAGKIHSWDVVNEAINPKDGRADGLRQSLWLEMLGPDYIDLAFHAAAKADPQALLVYNDYSVDYDTTEGETRRTAILKLLEKMKAKGTPIQALGIQAHLYRDDPRLNPKKLQNFLKNVADLGLKVMITELDVTDRTFPKDIKTRDRIVAAAYEDYLDVVLAEPAVIALLTWGLSDRYTWLSTDAARTDGSSARPLPLDAQMNRKLAWNAIARSLDRATQRPMVT